MGQPCRTVSVSVSTARPEENFRLETYEELLEGEVVAEGCSEGLDPFLEDLCAACGKGSFARHEILKLAQDFPDHLKVVRQIHSIVGKGVLRRRPLQIENKDGKQSLCIKVISIKAA